MLDYISRRTLILGNQKRGRILTKGRILTDNQLRVKLCKSLYQMVSMNNIYLKVQCNDHIYALIHTEYFKFI